MSQNESDDPVHSTFRSRSKTLCDFTSGTAAMKKGGGCSLIMALEWVQVEERKKNGAPLSISGIFISTKVYQIKNMQKNPQRLALMCLKILELHAALSYQIVMPNKSN